MVRCESRPSTIGHITLDTKQTGAPSAGNLHAGCDVAGAGNGFTVWLLRHSQRKRGETARLDLRKTAPVLDPTGQCLVIPMPLSRTGPAITSVMDGPAVRFPSSGTPLAHRNRPPQHPRAVARPDLLMARQSTQTYRVRSGGEIVRPVQMFWTFPSPEYVRNRLRSFFRNGRRSQYRLRAPQSRSKNLPKLRSNAPISTPLISTCSTLPKTGVIGR
jgi:hypothetical protein